MNSLLILTVLIFSQVTYSASPSVEGLFRNPSNGDVTTDTVLFMFHIKKENNEETLVSTDASDTLADANEYFVKYIFDLKLKNQVRLLKVFYSNKQMRYEDIVNVKYMDSLFSNTLEKDQHFFNALLSMLVLNRSSEIMRYLKDVSKDIKKNKEVLDREKLGLLNNYKSYLRAKEENPDLENPLKPNSEEGSKRVSEIMKKPLLTPDEDIKLVRRGEKFEWTLTLDAVQGVFENESLKMKKLEVQNLSTLDQVFLDNFILVDGVHEFPKYFKIILNGESFIINLIKISQFDSRKTSLRERYKDYNKRIKKQNIITKPISLPLI